MLIDNRSVTKLRIKDSDMQPEMTLARKESYWCAIEDRLVEANESRLRTVEICRKIANFITPPCDTPALLTTILDFDDRFYAPPISQIAADQYDPEGLLRKIETPDLIRAKSMGMATCKGIPGELHVDILKNHA